jgi:hypothetical protein
VNLTRWRDDILRITGISLIIYEAIFREGPERPSLLILYAGMVGLPAFLKVDGEKKEPREGGGL